MCTAHLVTMIMTDTGVQEAAVMKGGQEAVHLITTIADLIVLESKCCTTLTYAGL